jgi:transposase
MKALRVRALTENERKELEHEYHSGEDARLIRRSQMILLSSEGWKVGAIAGVVRESEDTVARWVKRYNHEGLNGLHDRPKSGAPRKIDAAYEAEVITAVRTRPRALAQETSLWTLAGLVSYMRERTGVQIGRETMRRVLARHGFVMSRPAHHVHSPDPEYLLKKRRLKRNVNR